MPKRRRPKTRARTKTGGSIRSKQPTAGYNALQRFWKGPGCTLTLAAAGALALGLGGGHLADRLRQRYSETGVQFSPAAIGRIHTLSTGTGDFPSQARWQLVPPRFYPDSGYCLRCHTYEEADARAKQTLQKLQDGLKNTFGKGSLHSRVEDSVFVFMPYESLTKGGALGVTAPPQAFLSLKGMLLPEEHRTIQHELVHFLMLHPHDYLNEPWAYTSEYMVQPDIIRQKPEELGKLEKAHGISLLQRALVFKGQVGTAKMLKNEQINSLFASLAREVDTETLRAMRPLYARALKEYQLHSPFWDAASAYFQHPYLLLDVMLAKHLEESKNKAFIVARADNEGNARLALFLKQAGPRIHVHPRNCTSFFSENHIDLRTQFTEALPHLQKMGQKGLLATMQKKTREERDALYFAALHRMFWDNSKLRQDAVPQKVLEKHAHARADAIVRTQLVFESVTPSGTSEADRNALKTLRPYHDRRRKLFEQKRRELERNRLSGNYLD